MFLLGAILTNTFISTQKYFVNRLLKIDALRQSDVIKLTVIGSDNGLSPDRRKAVIWSNAGISLIGSFGTNFSEILIETLTF